MTAPTAPAAHATAPTEPGTALGAPGAAGVGTGTPEGLVASYFAAQTANTAGLVPGVPVSAARSGPILLTHYQNQQQLIAAQAARTIDRLLSQHIDPNNVNESWRSINPLVNGVIDMHYQATAADAARFYTQSRIIAGNSYIPLPGAELNQEYLNTVTNSQGPGMFFHFLKDNPADNAKTMAQDSLRGAATRMVMMGGRDTVTQSAQQDPMAKGWERVIEPGACSFCAMLASRGAVYKSATADFRAHDHCHCVARPVFAGEKSVNNELSDAWARETRGTRGAAARAAWNQYWSNRNVGPEQRHATETQGQRAGNAPVAGQRKR